MFENSEGRAEAVKIWQFKESRTSMLNRLKTASNWLAEINLFIFFLLETINTATPRNSKDEHLNIILYQHRISY